MGPALSTLGELSRTAQPFDLVFIDADKSGYLDYLNVLLDSGLVATHGLICVDNTLMQGQPWAAGTLTIPQHFDLLRNLGQAEADLA